MAYIVGGACVCHCAVTLVKCSDDRELLYWFPLLYCGLSIDLLASASASRQNIRPQTRNSGLGLKHLASFNTNACQWTKSGVILLRNAHEHEHSESYLVVFPITDSRWQSTADISTCYWHNPNIILHLLTDTRDTILLSKRDYNFSLST